MRMFADRVGRSIQKGAQKPVRGEPSTKLAFKKVKKWKVLPNNSFVAAATQFSAGMKIIMPAEPVGAPPA